LAEYPKFGGSCFFQTCERIRCIFGDIRQPPIRTRVHRKPVHQRVRTCEIGAHCSNPPGPNGAKDISWEGDTVEGGNTLKERLEIYCRTTSASTAPRTPRRTCCPYAYVLITLETALEGKTVESGGRSPLSSRHAELLLLFFITLKPRVE